VNEGSGFLVAENEESNFLVGGFEWVEWAVVGVGLAGWNEGLCCLVPAVVENVG
jgi:hypothetical protein